MFPRIPIIIYELPYIFYIISNVPATLPLSNSGLVIQCTSTLSRQPLIV